MHVFCKRFTFLSLIFCITFIYAQPPDTLWTKTYGGTSGDVGLAAQYTSDGGYIIAGWTYSFGAGIQDFYVVKIDSLGNTLWTKTYGDTSYERAYSVQETFDGGFVIVGETWSFGAGGSDIYLVKINVSGDTTWTKTYGDTGYEWGRSVLQTSDGGYIITGTTDSYGAGSYDIYLIKTDSTGDTLWTKTYGGINTDESCSFIKTNDDSYVIVGYTNSFGAGSYDIYIIKINATGDTLWTRTYGEGGVDIGSAINLTSDGGYIVTGNTNSFGADSIDVFLMKIDSLGNSQWTKTYGGIEIDFGSSVQETYDGGLIVVGGSNSFAEGSSGFDVYLIKTNSVGDTLWTKTYGLSSGGIDDDVGYRVIQTSDFGYAIVGYTNSFGAGWSDVWFLRMEPDTFGIAEENATVVNSNNLGATIFSGPLLLPEGKNCKVFDIIGRVISTDKMRPGIYFLQIDGQITKKVVKIR